MTNKTVLGLLKISRVDEYFWVVIITTVLGVIAASGHFGLNFILALLANWLVAGFAFIVNDVEDADDDAMDSSKINRNPVSCKLISKKTGYLFCLTTAVLAIAILAFINLPSLTTGILTLILGFLYSFKRVRLKSVPVLDLLTHSLMLAGMQVLLVYLAFSATSVNKVVLPFVAVTLISMYGALHNQLRDEVVDGKTKINNTAKLIGVRKTKLLMSFLFTVATATGLLWAFFYVKPNIAIIPLFLVFLTLLSAKSLRSCFKAKTAVDCQIYLHRPVEVAASLTLFIYFLLTSV